MGDDSAIEPAIARGEVMEGSDPEGAVDYFRVLSAQYPGDARVLFAYAGALDFAGRETEAVAPYRKAGELGLPEQLLPRWHLQFGSTLRNVGEHAESVALLEAGRRTFPEDAAIACFLALAQRSAGDEARALRTALEVVLAAAEAGQIDLRGYQRALTWYAADLTGDAVE